MAVISSTHSHWLPSKTDPDIQRRCHLCRSWTIPRIYLNRLRPYSEVLHFLSFQAGCHLILLDSNSSVDDFLGTIIKGYLKLFLDKLVNHNEEQQHEDLLIRQALAGDHDAFETLVFQFSPVIFRSISRLFPDRTEVEAILQDTWLSAWRALPRYQTGRPFLPWVLRIAINRSRDIWKKKKELLFSDGNILVENFQDGKASIEDRIISDEELGFLARGVSQLRVPYRVAISLRYDSDLSYQEIAEIMEIPVNTVRTYLYRAKEELALWMESENDG
jgi:RNA polymerase sigma-70 factor, ECF subfamily